MAWDIWEEESAALASELVRRAVLSEGLTKNHPLVLHSDNGSPMKGATLLEMLYKLGITPSRSRSRVSNDNPYAESIFRTCKYRPSYPNKGFKGLEASRLWVLEFVRWYNNEHKHRCIRFVTPVQRHTGMDKQILENRKRVYGLARARHPERWTRSTRDWARKDEVWLNPEWSKHEAKSGMEIIGDSDN